MRKESIENARYPHTIKVVRVTFGDWLSSTSSDGENEQLIYYGAGRCFTSGGVGGNAVDITSRQISIPVRFDKWGTLIPSSGDRVEVTMGEVTETMEVKDFEPDNNRTLIYCKRNANLNQ